MQDFEMELAALQQLPETTVSGPHDGAGGCDRTCLYLTYFGIG
jgi:hypothetical protein